MDSVPILVIGLGLSVALQMVAAALALRLIPLSRGRFAWILVAVAQVLMAVRRGHSLWGLVGGLRAVDPLTEAIGIAISATMALSMYLVGVVLVERRKLEDQLRQAEKMEALGRLAGGVAHDFNNQLLVIMGHADEVARITKDAEVRSSAELIVSAARRSAALTRNLLTFARRVPSQAARVDMHALISEVEALLASTLDRRIVVHKDLRASTAVVSGDPAHLQNLLLNLGINARDAMPDGGRLTFSTRVLEVLVGSTDPRHRELAPGKYLAVSVTDTGCGIDEVARAHLFEPFFTTKGEGKGTGLGLASVYATARLHRGEVDVQSAPGEGSTFRVLLPLGGETVPNPHPSAMASERRPAPTPRKARILVVEDEAGVRDVLVTMLRRLGHEPIPCPDGARAVEIYARQWRETDLVIMDTVMPSPQRSETLEALKRVNSAVRVVVCSGYAADPSTEQPTAAGMVGYLHKPFVQEELAGVLARALPAGGEDATSARSEGGGTDAV